MRIVAGGAAEKRVAALARRGSRLDQVEPAVRRIVEDVRKNGDRALRRYAERWDGLKPKQALRVAEKEMQAAQDAVSQEFRSALEKAAARIRRFCEWQKPQEWRREADGVAVGQLVRPLDSVGCYVPGGRYPLPSTVLMTVIPAQVAGVRNIKVASPQPRPETLAAAAMLGVKEFYRIGGAQAVAALAYGTRSVPRVDKIVGPGNLYVTAAKKRVAFDCAIDMLAGPTEVAIVSDTGEARFIAADLVAQAEHDPEAIAVFITSSRALAKEVREKVEKAAAGNATAQVSLRANGAVLLASSRQQAMEWANRLAPEHITVSRENVPYVTSAGSIFVGDYSPQAAGDYASGPNHVLPTAGAARYRGGLSVFDFVKLITFQELTAQGMRRIAPVVVPLAEAEGLRAHAESIRVRCANA
ncbi:MAG: histidinol dehydrogenase [Acidobacteriia bacterium]|nr:histidinol dehydrogenase [Terriglobia bacterium]